MAIAGRAEAGALNYELSRRSLRSYLQIVKIDSQPQPRPLGKVADPWQWNELYNPLIPPLEYLCSSDEERKTKPDYTGPWNFWSTLPRGSDKTSSIGRFCNYLCVFGRRDVPLRISVAAADKNQAKLVRNAMETEARLNPWFERYIKINKYDASGPGGNLQILSADAGSAYGLGDDVIICDELTHWPAEDLWVAMTSGAIKRLHNLLVVITNAGYKGTLQHRALLEAKKSTNWRVYDEPGYKASWTSKEKLADMKRLIIASCGSMHEVNRLIDNMWISARMGSVFSSDDIEALENELASDPIFAMSC